MLYFHFSLMSVMDLPWGILRGDGKKNPALCGKTALFYKNRRVLSKLEKHQEERTVRSQIQEYPDTDLISDTCEILLLLIQPCNYSWLGISILLME